MAYIYDTKAWLNQCVLSLQGAATSQTIEMRFQISLFRE